MSLDRLGLMPGVRTRVAEWLELDAALRYLDFGDGGDEDASLFGIVGFLMGVRGGLSLGAETEFEYDALAVRFSVRFSFD